jgi:hypothetical protein
VAPGERRRDPHRTVTQPGKEHTTDEQDTRGSGLSKRVRRLKSPGVRRLSCSKAHVDRVRVRECSYRFTTLPFREQFEAALTARGLRLVLGPPDPAAEGVDP